MRDFGQLLKLRRRQLDLTQRSLAQRVNCSEGTIRKIESGSRRPSKQLAKLLAHRLHIPEDQISRFVILARAPDTLTRGPNLTEEIAALGLALNLTPPFVSDNRPVSPSVHTLPPQPTPFFGRQEELALLFANYSQPDRRLVTIVGPGGIGKTRLALSFGKLLAEQRPSYGDGVHFLDLSAAENTDDLLADLAGLFELRTEREPQGTLARLKAYLHDRTLLLILDNFEQLAADAMLIAEIWEKAPGVSLLITSREPLNLRAEWVLRIGGLPVPDPSPADWDRSYAAVEMFSSCARRKQLTNTWTSPEELALIGQICRLTGGMPLAIEMAAAWTDKLSLAEIAAELKEGLGLLASDSRDVPTRQQSVRATIDHSWRQLKPALQIKFAALSIFRGGFVRVSAKAVTGVNSCQLSELLSRSFITYEQRRSRFQLHTLLRQFAAEKLATVPKLAETTRQAHSHYFCQILATANKELISQGQANAQARLAVDSRNIQTAWNRAVADHLTDDLLAAVNSYGEFFDTSGRWLEGMALFGATAETLNKRCEEAFEPAAARLLIWLRGWRACLWLATHVSPGDLAEELIHLQQGMAWLLKLDTYDKENQAVEAFIHLQKGALLLQETVVDFEAVTYHLDHSLALYQALDDQLGIADALYWQHILVRAQGEPVRARAIILASLSLIETLGQPKRLISTLLRAGVMARVTLAFEEAPTMFKQAYHLAENNSDKVGMYKARMVMAINSSYHGRFREALAYLEEALLSSQLDHNALNCASSLVAMSQTQLYLGQSEKALAQLQIVQDEYPAHFLTSGAALGLLVQLHAGQTPTFARNLPKNDYDSLVSLAWLALLDKDYVQAQMLARRAQSVVSVINVQQGLAQTSAVLGYASVARHDFVTAQRVLVTGLRYCLDCASFVPLLDLLPTIAFLLVQSDDEACHRRGEELYAAATRHPYIGHSQLFQELIAAQLNNIPTSRPASEQPDWWELAHKLHAALIECSW